MTGGRQKAEENVLAFEQWVSSMRPEDFKHITFRGKLHRGEVAKAVGCAKSALQQNPRLKEGLERLEVWLREQGILSLVATDEPQEERIAGQAAGSSLQQSDTTVAKLHRMEQRILALEAENRALKQQLSRFTELSAVLAEMGRLPQ